MVCFNLLKYLYKIRHYLNLLLMMNIIYDFKFLTYIDTTLILEERL